MFKIEIKEKHKAFIKEMSTHLFIMLLIILGFKFISTIPTIKTKDDIVIVLACLTVLLLYVASLGIKMCLKAGDSTEHLYYKIGWTLFEKSIEGLLIGVIVAIVAFALSKA